MITSAEAIRYLGFDHVGLRNPHEALRRLRRTGRLQYTRIGRWGIFRREWLDELIEGNATRRQESAD